MMCVMKLQKRWLVQKSEVGVMIELFLKGRNWRRANCNTSSWKQKLSTSVHWE